MNVTLTINGDTRQVHCLAHESLKTVLRREGYYSVRFGSETGETGADAVLVDGRLVSSEVMLAAQADGHAIETVEGLAPKMSDASDPGGVRRDRCHPVGLLDACHDPRHEGAPRTQPGPERGGDP